MIYMEPHQLGWKPLKDSYMDTLPSSLTEEHRELVRPPLASPPSLAPQLAGLLGASSPSCPGGRRGRDFLACGLPTIFPPSPRVGMGC